jgi:hypothetical protein
MIGSATNVRLQYQNLSECEAPANVYLVKNTDRFNLTFVLLPNDFLILLRACLNF